MQAECLSDRTPSCFNSAGLEWTPSRLINWAATVGPSTAKVVQAILESKPHPEAGYRACLGILSLAKTFTPARLEAASGRALLLGNYPAPDALTP